MSKEKKTPCPEFSMEDWIKQPDPLKDDSENCRACSLSVTASWYYSELQEQGREDLAASLEKIAMNQEDPNLPLTLCQEFDRIKSVVEEPLRERLKDFDCATQSFIPDDVVDDSTTTLESRKEVT